MHRQTLGLPIKSKFAVQLTIHAAPGKQTSKTLPGRRAVKCRAASFFPLQGKLLFCYLPGDLNLSIRCRKGTVFRRIGRQLMQYQRQARYGIAANRHLRTLDHEAFDAVGLRDILIGSQNGSDQQF